MSVHLDDSLLGKSVAGSSHYDPGLLFPIPRSQGRNAIGLSAVLPFHGVDIWNAWELSWLDELGKPQVAVAEIRVPADSPNLIESKSLKLYLNSLNAMRYPDAHHVERLLRDDLGAAAGGAVEVRVMGLDRVSEAAIHDAEGTCIDDLPITIEHYGPPEPAFLCTNPGTRVSETLVSHLLKSNCPVTAQPDWASVVISYQGAAIERAGLLRYIVSYRNHDEFHEQCVERMFRDLLARCAPDQLSVSARYTRRGGLDINPWRGNAAQLAVPNRRLLRQ
ncbi:MAG: NADPH-dependent 7-cyano-7-deazaguanine reductase QueF [Dokdonella sp.]|jgi:7-cyano-7-deazaguanine reductase|uniref:NADPH-dependent 7-cyano-7-deazaguanine reductase QueF n=1 Tax=Dokdonella sp. TaxID=2291710 RepID=UPI0025C2053E|nr:NADPH-dependent 7-cyano-7-deazaguanine reductase QueF [Dokdonella sp.]MBK8123804.1 NADPH-dependent 7-cyano-7-deazaguanine reductase QueF [Dokdonella sp.]HNV09710.1 NADPH-dependent 7-cyano-7-deazaguanine reductase QueF [Dokdonella sp.]